MVLKGQFLERMTVVQRGEVGLEALYHRGDVPPPVVLAAPHPGLGGSMDSPVVAEAAWALTRAGHATLRFNYRGVGASQGGWDEGAFDDGDLEAAMAHLAETADHPRVALVGYSYGTLVATRVAARHPEVPLLALVAPPLGLLEVEAALEALARREGGPPLVLAIAPTDDPWCPPGRLGRALEAFEERATLDVVAGADHAFGRGLPEMGRLLADYFTARRAGA